jgi:hypothetical protein
MPFILIIFITIVYIKEIFISALSGIELYPLLKSVFNTDIHKLRLQYPLTEEIINEFKK